MHTLPKWVVAIQDRFLLPLLIIGSGYVIGIMLITGWVPDLQNPSTWGVLKGLGVIAFFTIGAAAGGLGLRLSYSAADAAQRKNWFQVFFFMVGVLLIGSFEIWASLSERSQNIKMTPADTWLLSVMGISPTVGISPTIIFIAFLPFVLTLYWGFAAKTHEQAPKAEIVDLEALKNQMEAKKIQAQANAEIRAMQVRNFGKTLRSIASGSDDSTSVQEDQDIPEPSHDDGIDQQSRYVIASHQIDQVLPLEEFDIDSVSMSNSAAPVNKASAKSAPKVGSLQYPNYVRKVTNDMIRKGTPITVYNLTQFLEIDNATLMATIDQIINTANRNLRPNQTITDQSIIALSTLRETTSV